CNESAIAGFCSAWLRNVCDLIHTAQKYLRATEIWKDPNSSLCRQPCCATPRANTNERNTNAATCASIPHPVSNVNGAAKPAISLGCPLHRQPDNGLSIKRIVARCRWIIVIGQASTRHLKTSRVTPSPSSKGDAILLAPIQARKQQRCSCDCCKSSFG